MPIVSHLDNHFDQSNRIFHNLFNLVNKKMSVVILKRKLINRDESQNKPETIFFIYFHIRLDIKIFIGSPGHKGQIKLCQMSMEHNILTHG
jgi:hypothetical protein